MGLVKSTFSGILVWSFSTPVFAVTAKGMLLTDTARPRDLRAVKVTGKEAVEPVFQIGAKSIKLKKGEMKIPLVATPSLEKLERKPERGSIQIPGKPLSEYTQYAKPLDFSKLDNVDWSLKGVTKSWKNSDGKRFRRKVWAGVFESNEAQTKGLKMAFAYSLPLQSSEGGTKPVEVMLHGVGDNQGDLQVAARENIKRGWGMLRVDLLGHGLTDQLNKPSNVIDYHDQVRMIGELMQKLGIENPIVFGHSMGGGLAMVLSESLERDFHIRPLAAIPVAGYLSAIDKFNMERGFTPDMIMNAFEKSFKKYNGGVDFYDYLSKNFALFGFEHGVEWLRTSTNLMVDSWKQAIAPLLAAQNEAIYQSGYEQAVDKIADPVMVPMMSKVFTKYLDGKEAKKEAAPNVPSSEGGQLYKNPTAEQLRAWVRGAIAATIGLRELNFLDAQHRSPMSSTVPTLYIAGQDDSVVTPPQVQAFVDSTKGSYPNIEVFSLKDATHFMPQQNAPEITALKLKFLLDRNLIRASDAELLQ